MFPSPKFLKNSLPPAALWKTPEGNDSDLSADENIFRILRALDRWLVSSGWANEDRLRARLRCSTHTFLLFRPRTGVAPFIGVLVWRAPTLFTPWRRAPFVWTRTPGFNGHFGACIDGELGVTVWSGGGEAEFPSGLKVGERFGEPRLFDFFQNKVGLRKLTCCHHANGLFQW